MKINKPENIYGLPLNQSTSKSADLSNAAPPKQGVPTDINLAKTFADMGLDISNTVVKSVAKALLSAGISSKFDSISALRALILTDLGIPLSKELIENDFTLKIFPEIAGISSDALNLASNAKLSPELREALTMLSEDLRGLYDFSDTNIRMREILHETAAIWASETSSLISDKFPEKIEQFEIAVKELIASFNSIEIYNSNGKEKLSQILTKFYYDAGFNPNDVRLINDSAISPIAVNLREFEKKLFRIMQLLTETNSYNSGDTLSAGQLAGLIRKTGMSFEWRLLAWYRSGKNPSKIRELIHDNLKGILLSFLKVSDKSDKNASAGRILAGINAKARTVFNELESRQIGGIINEPAEKRGFFIELPIGRNGESGTAKMWVQRDKEQLSKENSSDYFHMDFELDTMSAGLIKGKLSSIDKSLSVKFSFGDEKTRKVAENMASDLRDALSGKGFSLDLLDFKDIQSPLKSVNLIKKNGLDITG